MRGFVGEALSDRSLHALLASNVLALGVAYASGIGLREMMLVYWIQSVVIGATSFIRILRLDRFDPANFKIDNRQVEETAATKRKVAFFFLLHYGFFHLVYLLFVAVDGGGELGSARGYLLCALVFAVNHGYSLVQNMRSDAQGRPSIGALMFLPYARILPMHLTILFGGLLFSGTFAFVLFGALKTAADAVMHALEHHLMRRGIDP
jgi:Family of unknown function (DUF6498)